MRTDSSGDDRSQDLRGVDVLSAPSDAVEQSTENPRRAIAEQPLAAPRRGIAIGRCLDAVTELPIAGASVILDSSRDGWSSHVRRPRYDAKVVTDAAGGFSFAWDRWERTTLVVHQEGYSVERTVLGAGRPVDANGCLHLPDIRLRPQTMLHVTAVDESGSPVPGVRILIHKSQVEMELPSKWSSGGKPWLHFVGREDSPTTENDGQCEVGLDGPGCWTIVGVHSSYVPAVETLTANQRHSRLIMKAGRSLTVQIRDPSDLRPDVCVLHALSLEQHISWEYSVYFAKSDSCLLTFEHAWGRLEVGCTAYRGQRAIGQCGINLIGESDTGPIPLELVGLPQGTVEVRWPASQPLAGKELYLATGMWQQSGWAVTGRHICDASAGFATLAAWNSDRGAVFAYLPGVGFATPVELNGREGGSVKLRFREDSGKELQVYVRDANGPCRSAEVELRFLPPPDVWPGPGSVLLGPAASWVSVDRTAWMLKLVGLTDQQGHCRFRGVPRCPVEVRALDGQRMSGPLVAAANSSELAFMLGEQQSIDVALAGAGLSRLSQHDVEVSVRNSEDGSVLDRMTPDPAWQVRLRTGAVNRAVTVHVDLVGQPPPNVFSTRLGARIELAKADIVTGVDKTCRIRIGADLVSSGVTVHLARGMTGPLRITSFLLRYDRMSRGFVADRPAREIMVPVTPEARGTVRIPDLPTGLLMVRSGAGVDPDGVATLVYNGEPCSLALLPRRAVRLLNVPTMSTRNRKPVARLRPHGTVVQGLTFPVTRGSAGWAVSCFPGHYDLVIGEQIVGTFDVADKATEVKIELPE